MRASFLFFLVFAQAALGITTLVTSVPLALGLGHQAMAMLVLAIATLHRAGMGARR
ncbi:MAG: COX15/CtaA family protein [Hyphomicrobiales bacterium]